MPDIATVGLSQQRGHDGCGPTVGETGSSLMLVNGREVMTVTSTFVGHSCEHHGWHVPTVVAGSSVMFVEGQPVAYAGAEVGNCPAGNEIVNGDDLVSVAE